MDTAKGTTARLIRFQSMHLIEIFLPVRDNDGRPFGADMYAAIRQTLTDKFGGVTAFTRAPAHGEFKEGDTVMHDDIVVYEVMADALDKEWWSRYRRQLEKDFRQEEILIRAVATIRL